MELIDPQYAHLTNKEKLYADARSWANIECSAQNLFQFAVMGASVVESLELSKNPRVGLY